MSQPAFLRHDASRLRTSLCRRIGSPPYRQLRACSISLLLLLLLLFFPLRSHPTHTACLYINDIFFFLLAHSFWLSLTMRESLETSDLHTEHRPPFLSLSLIKTVSSCVVQIVCVITNQGSSNPNCLNFLKDAYKVYQGVPPTY